LIVVVLTWRWNGPRWQVGPSVGLSTWGILDGLLLAYLVVGAWHAYFVPQVFVLFALIYTVTTTRRHYKPLKTADPAK
jgi:hypothetical protein